MGIWDRAVDIPSNEEDSFEEFLRLDEFRQRISLKFMQVFVGVYGSISSLKRAIEWRRTFYSLQVIKNLNYLSQILLGDKMRLFLIFLNFNFRWFFVFLRCLQTFFNECWNCICKFTILCFLNYTDMDSIVSFRIES